MKDATDANMFFFLFRSYGSKFHFIIILKYWLVARLFVAGKISFVILYHAFCSPFQPLTNWPIYKTLKCILLFHCHCLSRQSLFALNIFVRGFITLLRLNSLIKIIFSLYAPTSHNCHFINYLFSATLYRISFQLMYTSFQRFCSKRIMCYNVIRYECVFE